MQIRDATQPSGCREVGSVVLVCAVAAAASAALVSAALVSARPHFGSTSPFARPVPQGQLLQQLDGTGADDAAFRHRIGQQAGVVTRDLDARNGVVHAIHRVLVPPSIGPFVVLSDVLLADQAGDGQG